MKKGFLLTCILGIFLTLVGCGGKKEVAKTEDGRTKIRVGAMGYYLSVPLAVIEDKKLDEKYGFDLEVIYFPSGGPMAEALGAGQWDIGPIGAGGMVAVPTYNAKLIGDVEEYMDGAWILARPDSDIVAAGNTLKSYPEVLGDKGSLEGKTMLGTIGNISHYMGLDYLDKYGLSIEDVNFIHMETSQIYTSFVTGNGDLASIGSPSAAMKLMDEGYKMVGGLKQQDKSQQDAMLVSDAFYTDNYEDTVNFMAAWYEAAGILNSDREYQVKMTTKLYSDSGRTDFDDAAVRQEVSMNRYVDVDSALSKPVGGWMTGLVEFMVSIDAMDKSVLDGMHTNIKDDVMKDALKKIK